MPSIFYLKCFTATPQNISSGLGEKVIPLHWFSVLWEHEIWAPGTSHIVHISYADGHSPSSDEISTIRLPSRWSVIRGSRWHNSTILQWASKISRFMMDTPLMVFTRQYFYMKYVHMYQLRLSWLRTFLLNWSGSPGSILLTILMPFGTRKDSRVTAGNVREGLVRGLLKSSGRVASF